MKRNSLIIIVLFVGVGLLLTGCKVKYTGGGTIETCDDGQKANFGFVFNSCKEDAIFNFLYNDKEAGVKFKGGDDFSFGFGGIIIASYTSKDGDGTVQIYVEDLGEGNGNHGYVEIFVLSGPYAGYFNDGKVSGNIQEHECFED
jgi:hypothetical protein